MNSKGIKKGFDEFGEIVKITMEKVIIPLLPVYIFTMICEMSAKGVIAVVIGAGAKIILTGVGLLESILGFSPEQTALLMTIYLALDGYGPACNVTGDGAVALIIDRISSRKTHAAPAK